MGKPNYTNNSEYCPLDVSEDSVDTDWYDADFADEMYKRYRLNDPPFTNNLGVY